MMIEFPVSTPIREMSKCGMWTDFSGNVAVRSGSWVFPQSPVRRILILKPFGGLRL